MPKSALTAQLAPDERARKKMRGEIGVILPFFLFSLYVFAGSFRYKFVAATVPMLIGLCTLILTGLRLFHLLFPGSRIGQFKEAGLAGEFDNIKEEIKEETLKGKLEEGASKKVTGRDEGKAFVALAFACLSFVLFGYVVGSLLALIGTALFYGYRRPVPVLATAAALFVLLYVVLHRLFGAEITWGVLLGPALEAMNLN